MAPTGNKGDSGYDMQPEFDRAHSEQAAVNYAKVRTTGELQDDLRSAGAGRKPRPAGKGSCGQS